MMLNIKQTIAALIAAALLAAVVPAHAATLGVHLASVHSNAHTRFNDTNPGIYGVTMIGGHTYAAGIYHNSEYRTSAYVARVFELHPYLFISAGVVTGYRSMRIAPLLTVSTQVPLSERSRLRLHLLPKAPSVPKSATALHASVEFDF